MLVSALCVSVVSLSLADDVRASIEKPVNIPAESLGVALKQLARQRGFQIIYVAEDLTGLRTLGAKGNFTSEQALNSLLRRTGYTFRYVDDHTVTIVLAAASGGEGDFSWPKTC